MPNRTYSATNSYRYGFNGKENDNEVKGEGNQQDYGMRVYDPRIGRFLSVDPIADDYPELTPYQFASNTPIQAIDLDGKEGMRTLWNQIKIWWNTESDYSTEVTKGYHAEMGVQEASSNVRYTNGNAVIAGFGAVGYSFAHTGPFYTPRGKTSNAILVKQPQAIDADPVVTSLPTRKTTTSQPVRNTNEQAVIANAKNRSVQNTNAANSISVAKRTPQTGPEFGSETYTIANGKINLNNRAVTNGTFDFVVTREGKLIIGSGHYNLSNEAETVQAAGRIRIYKGKVMEIDNSSGHYKPSADQTKNFSNILKEKGVDLSDATLNIYSADKTNNVKKVETIKL